MSEWLQSEVVDPYDLPYLSSRTAERLSICSDAGQPTSPAPAAMELPDSVDSGIDYASSEGIFTTDEAAALKRCWSDLAAARSADTKLFAQQFHLSMLDLFLTDAHRVEELFVRTMKSYAELGELVLREGVNGRRRSMLGDGDTDCGGTTDVTVGEKRRALKEQKRLFRLQLQELEEELVAGAIAAVAAATPLPHPIKQLSITSLGSSSSAQSKDTASTGRGRRRGSAAVSKRALSCAWAEHLRHVQPAKGVLSPSGSSSNAPLQVKLKWPEWLADEQFDVVKVNLYGKKYERTLKLTETHILSLRGASGVTKVYAYSDVDFVSLSTDGQALTLRFRSDRKTFHYIAPCAAHIAQQIATRIQVRSALESSQFSVGGHAGGHSAEAMMAIMASIVDDNARSNSSNFLAFAKQLTGRVAKGSPASATCSAKSQKEEEDLARRLQGVQKGSKEHAVQVAVRDALYDPHTAEGCTRQHFIRHFDARSQGLSHIRQWVEGMHEYLLERRAVDLYFVYTGADREICPSIQSIEDIDALSLVTISFLVFTIVEQSVFTPLQGAAYSIIQDKPGYREREAAAVRNIHALSARSQREWEIPAEYESSLQWRAAVFELEGLERNPTPSARLDAIVRTAKAIYSEFANEVLPRLHAAGKEATLGADDLVPIFLFVLSRSRLSSPLTDKDLLWGLCHPDQLYGESGYYLTIYESAVAFCENPDQDRDEDDDDDEYGSSSKTL